MNQKNYFFTLMFISFVLNSLTHASLAQARPQGAPPAPPASAYTACADKSAGESATDGNVSGTCEVGPDGKIALRPDGPPPNQDSGSEQSAAQ